jgi:hypothetical protein
MYKVGMIRPSAINFGEVAASSVEEAVNMFMEQHYAQGLATKTADGIVYYAIVSVAGHGDFCARYFQTGIGRKGGLKKTYPTPQTIEERLALPAGMLDSEGWLEEETPDEAFARKYNH